MVFGRAFEKRFAAAWASVVTLEAVHALWITILIIAIVVPANTIFGIPSAVVSVRHRFRGKRVLNALVEVPLDLSPIVVDHSVLVLFGTGGWLHGVPCDV